MLTVATQWFGLPHDLDGAIETVHRIRRRGIETLLMLELRLDLMETATAKNFVASAMVIEKEFTHPMVRAVMAESHNTSM
jgi:hypothetical protein